MSKRPPTFKRRETNLDDSCLTTALGHGILRNMSNTRTEQARHFARIFKALSNPHRLEILLRLVSCCAPGTRCSVDDEGRACVGDIGKDLGIVPSTVSHHIKELHEAGLIRTERRGQRVECWVDPETMTALKGFFV